MTGQILEGYLNYQRSTLLNICAGLSGEQLAHGPIRSSNLSLLGLIRHLAKVERIWFRQRARPAGPAHVRPGPGEGRRFQRCRRGGGRGGHGPAAGGVAPGRRGRGLDFDGALDTGHGDTFSVRMMYVHLIGEYARHNGHADLLREALDGVTGR